MPTTLGFTGQRQDSSGLDYFNARFYDPVVGQFTSADDQVGPNRYAYVQGNPETLTDPTGYWPWDAIAHAVSSAVSAVAQATVQVVQTVAPVVATVVDQTLGISSMISDVKTLFDPKVSFWSKALAFGDLALNAVQDAQMLIRVGEAARAGYLAVKAGAKVAQEVAEHEVEHVAEREIAGAAEHDAEHLAQNEARDTAKDVCFRNSFAAGTPVATPDGAKPIGQLQVGDQVTAYDPATGKTKAETVEHVFIHHDTNLLDVTLAPLASPTAAVASPDDAISPKQARAALASHGLRAPPTETLHTTTEHPFLTTDRGFVTA